MDFESVACFFISFFYIYTFLFYFLSFIFSLKFSNNQNKKSSTRVGIMKTKNKNGKQNAKSLQRMQRVSSGKS